MVRKKKILIITGSVLFAIIILLPCAALAVIKWAVLPPDKLTPLALGIANDVVNGKIDCENIELTFFETFPKVGLKLTNGSVVSHSFKNTDPALERHDNVPDTLLRFSGAVVSVDIMDYFRRNKVTVERLRIEDPYFFGFVDNNGISNWDIFKGSTEPNTEDTVSSSIPIIDLQRLRIKNGRFIYTDLQENMYVELEGFNLGMTNVLTKGNLSMKLKTGFRNIIFTSPLYTLQSDLSAKFESTLDISRDKVTFNGAKLLLNDLPFNTAGFFQKHNDDYYIDLDFDFKADDITRLVEFIPDEYLRDRRNISTRGSVALAGRVSGLMNDSLMPNVNLTFMLDKARLRTKDSKHGIERLDTDLDLSLNWNHPDSSFVNFRKLHVEGTNTAFSASGRVNRIFTDPYVDTRLKGKIDFAGLLEDIIDPDSMRIRGVMNADIEAAFRIQEMIDGNFSNLKAAGTINMDRLLVSDRAAGLSMFMKGIMFSADTTRQHSRYLTNDDLFSALLKVDTLNIRYKDQMHAGIGRLDMQVKTSRTIDTTTVIPATATIKMDAVRARLPDSVWIVGKQVLIAGGTKASQSNKKSATLAGTVRMDTLRYFDIPARTRIVTAKPLFNLEMMPRRDALIQRRQTAAANNDSLDNRRTGRALAASQGIGRNNRTDSLRRRTTDTVRGSDNEIRRRTSDNTSDDITNKLLRNWEVRGSVKFNSTRVFTAMFPLPMSMRNTTVRFDTDKVILSNANLKAGKSDFLLSGELSGMRRAKLRGGTLQADLTIECDYIDCNQLLRAVNRSPFFSETVTAWSDGGQEETLIQDWENETSFEENLGDDDAGLFVVPANIDMVLRTTAKRVDFDDVKLENIEGEVVVRNQSVNLRKLDIGSSLGSGNLTMVYMASDPKRAFTGFELEMKDIIVEELIKLFPSMDSLLPMLRSFEGVVDCQMTATCELDSEVNVVLPTLHSACYLNGENMVLMDGETFAEISKKLMFKNKKRNLIDYISVDLSVKDNKIEVFPFMVEIDRYKLAVGGIHHLDMTFDYHVSVLRSPVPFKLGIDIRGNLDDYKFKIVKCKYKNMFTAAREQQLQDTRLNLRSAIRDNIFELLRQNAPELAKGYDTRERISSRRTEMILEEDDPQVQEIEEGDEVKYLEYRKQVEILEAAQEIEEPL